MISHVSLLYISLAPVVAYIIGAIVFSLIGKVHKSTMLKRPFLSASCRNGLS
jgi:hypothetical protein